MCNVPAILFKIPSVSKIGSGSKVNLSGYLISMVTQLANGAERHTVISIAFL
jgi:hypothetical protein